MSGSPAAIRALTALLEQRTDQRIADTRQWRIGTALTAVLRKHDMQNLDQLALALDKPGTTPLATEIVEALVNNETYFFRDRAVFDMIAKEILPELARRREGAKRLAIWSAGCSTGQETLSLAMIFAEQKARWQGWTIDILGTDVSPRAIAIARKAVYPQFQIQRGLGITQMLASFDETEDGWAVRPELRRMVRYTVHNILDQRPVHYPFDLILCRNVLLYFDRDTRARAFDRLAEALAPGGNLLLGGGETAVGQNERLAPVKGRPGFFSHPEPAQNCRNLP